MKSRFLTRNEIENIFSCMPFEHRLPFIISLQTGMRIGDVLKLKRKDLKLISDSIVEVKYIAEKTGKLGYATVRGENAVLLLRRKRGFLFPSERGSKSGHITRQTAWGRFKRAADRADVSLDGCSPHSLRKSFAVELRHERGIVAAQHALQHDRASLTALYAFSDAFLGIDAEEPITWGQVGVLADVVAELITSKLADT